MGKFDTVEIDGVVEAETDAAYLFNDGEGDPVWLPKSQVEWDEKAGVMSMPEWLATNEGFV